MSERQKTCLFCGTTLQSKKSKTGAKSDEHIIPQWLLDHLGIRDWTITPMRIESTSGRIIDQRQHNMAAFKAGTVCKSCNIGWMNKLERQAQPILTLLIENPKGLQTLSKDERTIVSRWTLKTAAVLNRASTYGNPWDGIARFVPDEHLRALRGGTMPDSVV